MAVPVLDIPFLQQCLYFVRCRAVCNISFPLYCHSVAIVNLVTIVHFSRRIIIASMS